MMHWLWGVAESMDWNRRRPRWFWRWLLARIDRRFGYYEGYRPTHGPQEAMKGGGPQQGPYVQGQMGKPHGGGIDA